MGSFKDLPSIYGKKGIKELLSLQAQREMSFRKPKTKAKAKANSKPAWAEVLQNALQQYGAGK